MKQSALYIALLPLLFTPAIYAETVASTAVLDNRAARVILPSLPLTGRKKTSAGWFFQQHEPDLL